MGWRPNRRIRQMCYDCSAEFYGVWLWEYLNVLAPLLQEVKMRDHFLAAQNKGELMVLALSDLPDFPQHYGVKDFYYVSERDDPIDLGGD